MKAQKMWILKNTKTGKAIKIAVETCGGDGVVYAIGFETKNGLIAALDIDSPKELKSDERIIRIEVCP